jgi:hypothetical protein
MELTPAQKRAKSVKEKYGDDFFARVGSTGGKAKVPKGFGKNSELARKAGSLGGLRRAEKIRQSKSQG